MDKSPPPEPTVQNKPATLPRVLVATTAMLAFIPFLRAAAVVVCDMGSSAFYAGAIAEEAVGESAPWFILAVMLFAFAVGSMYIESCSMFVRGGVYRVVKEAMGGTMAKFSVSALLFDYVLTGPISGVSAGLYLTGFLNELLRYFGVGFTLPTNRTAALFAAVAVIYFWWQNVKGIPESSEKALRIMYVTAAMVAILVGWSIYTVAVRGAQLPPFPFPENLHLSDTAVGWLRHTNWPHTIAIIGILIGLGHSVLAMSGEETMAQVYREVEHPKLFNLKKAALVVLTFSLIFTAGVAFFASMIIPDAERSGYFANLIGGIAMHLEGPLPFRLGFRAFVVLAGILMLSGAVNTAIIGSSGVLNRVSEDGILPRWFRHPHSRYGTSYRILNLIVGLQLLTIFLSQGDIFILGEAYAFGVMWSFATKGLAVLVLRYKKPGAQEFRVPPNVRIGNRELPIGLGFIAVTLLALCLINLVTKEVATIGGVAFTLVFFGAFTYTERYTKRREKSEDRLDQFNLEPGAELSPQTVGVRPGNILISVRDFNTLYHLPPVLDRIDTKKQDIVALHIRLLARASSGEHDLEPEQLFGHKEQELFTRALSMAEKKGKTIHLAVAAATEKWDGMLRAAQNLQASTIVLGRSTKVPLTEEARRAGLAWEGLPEPKPHVSLHIYTPAGHEEIFYLGPHAPHLTLKDIDLLHKLWLRFSNQLGQQELHHHDVVHFALSEMEREIAQGKNDEVMKRLRDHLKAIQARRSAQP